ncbi:MAG TPA: glycosyltransferase family 9 protein, partial [Bacteroidia bacterium]
SLEEIEQAYGFKSKAVIPAAIKQLISSDKKNIILHAKSQGSGREWGLENFGRLIELLDPTKYSVFISGTEKEKPLLQPLIDKYPRAIDITGKLTLAEFITFIDSCEALIAASTGPLHIAAGFGKYAIGLFPSVRPMHPGRWAPIGKHAHVVMMKEDCENCKPKSNCVCENNNEAKEVFGILESIRK